MDVIVVHQAIIQQSLGPWPACLIHESREEAISHREGVYDGKIGLGHKVKKHGSVSIGVGSVVLKTWDYPDSGIKISKRENRKSISPKFDCLSSYKMEEILVPLDEPVTLVALAGNVDVEKCHPCPAILKKKPLSFILHILKVRRDFRRPAVGSELVFVDYAEATPTLFGSATLSLPCGEARELKRFTVLVSSQMGFADSKNLKIHIK